MSSEISKNDVLEAILTYAEDNSISNKQRDELTAWIETHTVGAEAFNAYDLVALVWHASIDKDSV